MGKERTHEGIRELLVEKTTISITHDSCGYIYVDWKGYLTVENVQDGCEDILASLKKMKVMLVVVDNRNVQGSWTQSIRWLEMDFMPRLVKAGLEKIAYIYSFDKSARYSLDRFLEVNDQYAGQTFEDFDIAVRWLLGEYTTEVISPSLFKLPVRQGNDLKFVEVNNILYVSCMNGQVAIHTKDKTYHSNSSLKATLEKVPSHQIIQVHKSYAVNLKEISSMKYYAGGSYQAFLKDLPKTSIPVGRKFAPGLKKALGIN